MALLPRISGITFSFNMEESCKTGIFSDSVVEPSIQQIHHLPWWCLAQRLCCSRGHRTGANQRRSSNSSPPNWMFKRGFPPVVKHEKFLMKSGCKWPTILPIHLSSVIGASDVKISLLLGDLTSPWPSVSLGAGVAPSLLSVAGLLWRPRACE